MCDYGLHHIHRHEALSYYFERGYTFEVKYAMDEVFILISSIMMGQDTNNSHLTDITNVLHEDKIPFLQSLSACLDTAVGFEYFIRYLQQTWYGTLNFLICLFLS